MLFTLSHLASCVFIHLSWAGDSLCLSSQVHPSCLHLLFPSVCPTLWIVISSSSCRLSFSVMNLDIISRLDNHLLICGSLLYCLFIFYQTLFSGLMVTSILQWLRPSLCIHQVSPEPCTMSRLLWMNECNMVSCILLFKTMIFYQCCMEKHEWAELLFFLIMLSWINALCNKIRIWKSLEETRSQNTARKCHKTWGHR